MWYRILEITPCILTTIDRKVSMMWMRDSTYFTINTDLQDPNLEPTGFFIKYECEDKYWIDGTSGHLYMYCNAKARRVFGLYPSSHSGEEEMWYLNDHPAKVPPLKWVVEQIKMFEGL